MNRKAKQSRGFLSGAVVVMAIFVTYMMVQLPLAKGDAKTANSTANQAISSVSALQQSVEANRKSLLEANRRLEAAGKQTVPVPTPTPIPALPVPDGLNAGELAAVRLVVAAEVAKAKTPLSEVEITQIARVAATFVPKPKDGKSVTAAELQPLVAVAIATYCGEDRCTGDDGHDGTKGDKGEPGKDAPKVTDEQLRSLVAASLKAYCAQDDKPCEGIKGDKGDPCDPAVNSDCIGPIGPVGAEGRGIADVDCNATTRRWEVLYTKGANSTEGDRADGGPCLTDPLPTTIARRGR